MNTTALPRRIRDEVARRFMAEFGMSGATAVRYAKAMLEEGIEVEDETARIEHARRVADRLAGMSRAELARFMQETPWNIHNRRAARQGRDYRPRDNDGRLAS